MKKISRIAALVLAIVLIASVAVGCHKKDEIAYRIDDYEFTSAMYSCVLSISASDARSAIKEFLSNEGKSTDNIKYEEYKFNDKGEVSKDGTVSYKDYILNKTMTTLKQYVAVEELLKEKEITVDADYIEEAKVQASYYWYVGCDYSTYEYYAAYGVDPSGYFSPYANFFEPNGVGYSTYEKYMVIEYKYNFLFEKIYGEKGEKEVPKAELTEYLNKHYAIADSIDLSTTDSEGKALSDAKKKEVKEKADKLAERIKKGEKFDKVYNDYQESLNTTTSSSSSTTTSSAASSVTSSATSSAATSSGEKEYTPEAYVNVFGDKETTYENDLFEDVYKLEQNAVTVLEDKDASCYKVLVRRDILKEEYWLKNFRGSITFTLRQDEFDKTLADKTANVTVTADEFALKPFTVEKIKFD